ncbi:chromosomal replication initiator protein DnaA [Candidatus Manganitrophus noduliformans]|uniref:Chromosomal replication initiator protein DnaA n=1 Tax=Candidatus Manganitrophus noduliformans TaxID=2606439 RepID=A0A7X6I9K3_9BACT|nr:chromosomal replication initiator protein DnaA [Candidatus Manganitrophus noduliformans]NKE69516.1 chromosomal replication initiator protein DnaA [Candidatus Manganitrophus noduliformans]
MQLDQIWKQLLVQLEPNINRQSFETWLKPTSLVSISGKDVHVAVPNRFFGEWIKEHYYPQMQEALERELSEEGLRIHFVVDEKGEAAGSPERERRKGNLNPRYTFDSFVVGSSNQFAHAASRKVAERPGTSYNPLFLYGGVGLGKTHLLSAIGNFISTRDPLLRIAYLSSEQFTNDVINSIRYDKMIEFRNKYRNVDALLIDDIQFISGKERTQEEFFHTFNTLYEANKQVVISSDRSAKEMSDIEERLRSRFEMGLIADIQPPDLETKIVILRRKAEGEGIPLPNDVALLLATHIKTNVRELEGALIRLGAFSSLTGQEITVEMAKRVLRDTIQEKKRVVTIEDIQRAVAERFQIKLVELKSKKRTKNLVIPRQICMFLCRELTSLSFPEIGKHFGGKDHSTVIHACKQIEKGMGEDFSLKTTLDSLTQNLKED